MRREIRGLLLRGLQHLRNSQLKQCPEDQGILPLQGVWDLQAGRQRELFSLPHLRVLREEACEGPGAQVHQAGPEQRLPHLPDKFIHLQGVNREITHLWACPPQKMLQRAQQAQVPVPALLQVLLQHVGAGPPA